MTIYWQKDAGGNARETAASSQISELSRLFGITDSRSAELLGVSAQRRSALIKPLFHLERELATAANIQEAVNALLRASDSLFEPALSSLVFASTAEPSEEGYFLARFQGRTTLRRFGSDAARAPMPTTAKQTQWRAFIRSLWPSTNLAAEYLGRDAVCLPIKLEEQMAGALLLWPDGRQTWLAADLQAAHLAVSLTSSAIYRLSLQSTVTALQQQLLQARAQVSRVQEQARRSERLASIGQRVSSVAHDLSSPLTSVIGYAQLLQDTAVPDTARRHLQILNEEARQCQHIAQNLLGFVRCTGVELGCISLHDVIRRTMELHIRGLEVDGIEVTLDLEPHMSAVLGDAHSLQQVLVNLVNNARDAMAQSGCGSTLRIATRVIARNRRAMAQIRVDDDGPGVPENIRGRIFEPFFTTKHGSGTGLGLSIARQLISDMGGDLSLDASDSRGAHFVIELPLAADSGSMMDSQDHPQESERPISRPACSAVLIIEDDENLADLMGRGLEGLCDSVAFARNGAEALQHLAVHDVDLILMDLRMPQSDGWCTYESLRDRYRHLLPRLVFTTGDATNAETRQWLESTGRPVLEKPFDLDQLRHVVHQVLYPGM